jgi:monomeric sarcosine oxidase
MRRFDVVVVGMGGIGSSAAFHIASRGAKVLALDPFPIAHAHGSSHGQTRLIRLAYFEHPNYVPLLLRAWDLWRDLERRTGRRLLSESGLVMAGPSDGEVIAGAVRAAETHCLPLERLSAGDACRRWPQLRLPEPWAVVHERQAGYLAVEACVAAHAEAAERAGATLEIGTRVLDWRSGSGGIVVKTEQGDVHADRLVLAPGPWAADIIRLPRVPLVVLRKSLFWYRPDRAAAASFAAGAMPCFAFDAPTGFFYGFPSLDDRGVKIAEHSGGSVVEDPLDVDRRIDDLERQRVEAISDAHLPDLGTTLTDHAVCLYTMSPDRHFVVGRHPDHERVVIAAGFSGHGFKFASVLGEVIAEIALDGSTRLPVDFLSPNRF